MFAGANQNIIKLYSQLYKGLLTNERFYKDDLVFAEETGSLYQPRYYHFFKCDFQNFQFVYNTSLFKRFFIVFLHEYRPFYMDVDLKLSSKTKHIFEIRYIFYKCLLSTISKTLNITKNNIYIWDSTRFKKEKQYFKISAHVLVPQAIFHIQNIEYLAKKISFWLSRYHVCFMNAIDCKVYKQIQLFRLPFCSNKDDCSHLLPIHVPQSITPLEQIRIHCRNLHGQSSLQSIVYRHVLKQKDEKNNNEILTIINNIKFMYNTHKAIFNKTIWNEIITTNNPNASILKIYKIRNGACLSTGSMNRSQSQATLWNHGNLKWLHFICCNICKEYYYFSLTKFNYPWLYRKIYDNICEVNIKEIDYLLHLFFTNKVLVTKKHIMNTSSIFNIHTLIMCPTKHIKCSLLMYQQVQCSYCLEHGFNNNGIYKGDGSIICQVRSFTHRLTKKFGSIGIYCHTCRTYLDSYLP